MPNSIVEEVKNRNGSIEQVTNMSLEEAVNVSHVLYVTRIQRERFENEVRIIMNAILWCPFRNYLVYFRRNMNVSLDLIVLTPN